MQHSGFGGDHTEISLRSDDSRGSLACGYLTGCFSSSLGDAFILYVGHCGRRLASNGNTMLTMESPPTCKYNPTQTHKCTLVYSMYFPPFFPLIALLPATYFLPTCHVPRLPAYRRAKYGNTLKQVSSTSIGYPPTFGSG